MKTLLLIVLITFLKPAFSEEAIIHKIDDVEVFQNYVEVSDEGLPQDHYLLLLEQIYNFRFTMMTEENVSEIFTTLTKDSRARMRRPSGACSTRRAYIQSYLKKRNLVSGRLMIHCPANNGRLRLKDQSTGYYYTYSNFHDTNVVTVEAAGGPDFRVLDVQFKDRPVSLHEYLAEIEASQKIRPKKSGYIKRYCTWYISTPYLSL